MTRQKCLLTGHFFTMPVILTGHIFTTSQKNINHSKYKKIQGTEMCYQTKRVGLRIHYKTTMCIYDRSKPDFDRAKMKLTGHFDRIHFLRYFDR